MPVPVHHVRADCGDHRPGVDVVRHQRGAVHARHAAHGVPVRLLLLLPRQDARPVRPPGEPLRRLPRPLLLRVLRPLPGVPRAQEAGLRHEARYDLAVWWLFVLLYPFRSLSSLDLLARHCTAGNSVFILLAQ